MSTTPWTRDGHVIPAVRGKVSWFGGPDDHNLSDDEGLSLSRGLAKNLNPKEFYIAMRWHIRKGHIGEDKAFWNLQGIYVCTLDFKKICVCRPVDWGPAAWTKRVADLSPAAMDYLELITDKEALFAFAGQFAKYGPVDLTA